jgi:Mn-dependent DtxR family transcriptional regulator
MPSTFLSVQQSTLDVKAGNSEVHDTDCASRHGCTDKIAERIERLAPSVRDGESVGVIERKAAWMARAYGIEYSDALEEMVWFLWRRPDLLGEEYSDGWLANRCVYHVRSRLSRERARGSARLDEERGAESVDARRAGAWSEYGEVADLLDELAPQVQALAAAILENEDTVHQSSGRANVACLARRLKVRPETVRARIGKLASELVR